MFKAIEKHEGRGAGVRFGPRTLDLDLLLYDDLEMKTKKLTLPHPRMISRKFVLKPLLEIAPKLRRVYPLPTNSERVIKYRDFWI